MSKFTAAVGNALDNDRNLVDTGRDLFVRLRDADSSALHKRLHHQLLPWYIGLSDASAAIVMRMFHTGPALWAGGLATAACTAGLYLPASRKQAFTAALADWVRVHPMHSMLCGIAAWIWYATAVILGFGHAPALTTLGLTALYLLSARWWQHHRIPYVSATVADEIAEVITEEDEPDAGDIDRIVEKWAARVAKSGGALPGTRLGGRAQVKAGYAYDLHLVEGKQTITEALAALPRIATALNVPQRNLLVEDVQPTADDPDPDPAILRFQVITNSPIKKIVPLTGPRWLRDGDRLVINLGPFADGEGFAPWRVFTENSMWGGYVVGDIGAGKSCISEIIGLSLMDTGLVSVFYVDPQDGASSPNLFEHADWPVGNDPERQDRLATGLEYLIQIRGAQNRVEFGTGGFTPGWNRNVRGEWVFRPGIAVIIDECHNVFNRDTLRWAKIAREGRKVGVAVIALSQIYGLDAFGQDDALRQSITGANTVALRVGRNQASLIHGLPISPADLPNIPGYGIVTNVEPGKGRTAPFRSAYAPEGERKTMMAAAAAKQAPLDELAIGALDVHEIPDPADETGTNWIREVDYAYSRRASIAEDDLRRSQQMLDDLRAGRPTPMIHTVRPEQSALPVLADFVDRAAGSEPGLKLTGLKRVLYEAVGSGITETAALISIARSAGFSSDSWIDQSLRDLVNANLIARGVKQGFYEKVNR